MKKKENTKKLYYFIIDLHTCNKIHIQTKWRHLTYYDITHEHEKTSLEYGTTLPCIVTKGFPST